MFLRWYHWCLIKLDEPTHTVVGPLIVPAFAPEFTVTLNEDEDAPQILVTV